MFTFITILLLAVLAGGIYAWYIKQQKAPPVTKPLTVEAPSRQDLPQKYGKDEIVLMVKDPYWLYAYWELTDARKEELRNRFGISSWNNSRPVLRVYELTGSIYDFLKAPFYEIAITDIADNWYIHTNKPSSTYCVDLGRWIPDYGFVTIARSNIVTTPSDRPSYIIDPMWPPIEACWEAVSRYGRGIVSSPQFLGK